VEQLAQARLLGTSVRNMKMNMKIWKCMYVLRVGSKVGSSLTTLRVLLTDCQLFL
jgi:hypothetical protein